MTSNNYRKWNLVGGRGGPPEQLVDSDSQPRYICTPRLGWRGEQSFIDKIPNLQSGPGATCKNSYGGEKKNNGKRRQILSLLFNGKYMNIFFPLNNANESQY